MAGGGGGGGLDTVIALFCTFPGSKEQSLGCRVCVTSPLLTATVSLVSPDVGFPNRNQGLWVGRARFCDETSNHTCAWSPFPHPGREERGPPAERPPLPPRLINSFWKHRPACTQPTNIYTNCTFPIPPGAFAPAFGRLSCPCDPLLSHCCLESSLDQPGLPLIMILRMILNS